MNENYIDERELLEFVNEVEKLSDHDDGSSSAQQLEKQKNNDSLAL